MLKNRSKFEAMIEDPTMLAKLVPPPAKGSSVAAVAASHQSVLEAQLDLALNLWARSVDEGRRTDAAFFAGAVSATLLPLQLLTGIEAEFILEVARKEKRVAARTVA